MGEDIEKNDKLQDSHKSEYIPEQVEKNTDNNINQNKDNIVDITVDKTKYIEEDTKIGDAFAAEAAEHIINAMPELESLKHSVEPQKVNGDTRKNALTAYASGAKNLAPQQINALLDISNENKKQAETNVKNYIQNPTKNSLFARIAKRISSQEA